LPFRAEKKEKTAGGRGDVTYKSCEGKGGEKSVTNPNSLGRGGKESPKRKKKTASITPLLTLAKEREGLCQFSKGKKG